MAIQEIKQSDVHRQMHWLKLYTARPKQLGEIGRVIYDNLRDVCDNNLRLASIQSNFSRHSHGFAIVLLRIRELPRARRRYPIREGLIPVRAAHRADGFFQVSELNVLLEERVPPRVPARLIVSVNVLAVTYTRIEGCYTDIPAEQKNADNCFA